ncbi:MAG: phosphate regulon sensor histidine kinase PhoR [Betaproteobacteria bacterium]|jgi:phosphate regulon sensor kinase PhoR|nr:phosphate regulon sensor histidine kinase PhoR [Betaproteobacteria bacterium]
MQSFLRYILGILPIVILVCGGVTLWGGWTWGLGSLAVLMGAIAARDAWKLQQLHRWLQNQGLSTGHGANRTWEQVFWRLHSLEKRFDENREQLSEVSERFQQALALLPNGIIILDRNHRILWCNPAAEQQLHIQFERDRGQSLPYLIRRTEFQEFMEHPPTLEKTGILHLKHGNELTLSLQLVSYNQEERMLVTHDITQWERDEKVRQDFVANVSHELRTPLTVIGGYVETLQTSGPLPPATQDKILATVATQTLRMHRLVEELLSLSRLESQSGSAPSIPVPLADLAAQILQTAHQLSQDHHHVTQQGTWEGNLLGTETELVSAFANLVANAIRYTPSGGHITICWERQSQGGVFSVKDTGIGIEAEHIPRLTERFYRVDRARSRDTGGTGLGLAIVQRIAQHHEATLTIDSSPGKGSIFSLHFPLHRISTT